MIYKSIANEYNNLLLNIKEYFDNKNNIVLFKERNIVKIVDYNNQKYVVKSFKIPHLLNKIVYKFFRNSKAKRSYENSVKLLDLNINTPKPIGYIEFPSLIFFMESFYISEFFNYDFEIRAVFKDKLFKDRDNILKEFIEFSYELHNKGVYHIDYSPGNILVKKVDDKYLFYIIDVNRMQFLDFDIDLRMKSMSKLTADRDDNNFIASYYSKISNLDHKSIFDKYSFHLDKEKKYLENKKKLKKLKG